MRNILLLLLASFVIGLHGCQEKEPPKYYAIDGTEFNKLESRIEYEEHIRIMRKTQINISEANGELTDYIKSLIEIKYNSCDKMISFCRSSDLDYLKIRKEFGVSLEKDTFKAYNSEIFYREIIRDDFNQSLKTLDSLNIIIGLKGYNVIKYILVNKKAISLVKWLFLLKN